MDGNFDMLSVKLNGGGNGQAGEAPLPVRQPRLASWSSRKNGHYLLRNRSTGETFQLGQEEQFILGQLDGRLTAEQVRAAFAARFGRPLPAEELAEFIALAAEHGFLRPDEPAAAGDAHGFERRGVPPALVVGQPDASAPSATGRRDACHTLSASRLKRVEARLLTVVVVALRGMAGLLQRAAQKIRFFRLKHFDYVPRSDDIFIVTYPRSGTTWLQMILYQLTTDGSMDIPHIAEYCPWFERSLRSGRGFETQPPPRIFKSHLRYRAIPKGPCKYIYVARDGRDVVVSYYHLSRMYCGFEGTLAQFFEKFMRGKLDFGSWFDHVRGWAEHRHDPNVLFLTYEGLTRDLEGCVRRIIAFCELAVPPEKLPLILERCAFAFMKKHEAKFDPTLETLWEQGVHLNSFLRAGKSGEGALHLSKEQQEQFGQALRRHFGENGLTHLA